jgi:type IV secretory pathway VirB10-like protein
MGTPPEKRPRLTEEVGETSISALPSRPPLKKRFTGTFNIQPVIPPPPPPPPVSTEPPIVATPSQVQTIEHSVSSLLFRKFTFC